MRSCEIVIFFGYFYFSSARNYLKLDYELGIILVDLLR
jgi:hypothetical protein